MVFIRVVYFLVELEFGDIVFCGGRKTVEPSEKPSKQGREPTTNSSHIRHRAGIKPGPHWWEAIAFTTVPTLLPNFDDNFTTGCWSNETGF